MELGGGVFEEEVETQGREGGWLRQSVTVGW